MPGYIEDTTGIHGFIADECDTLDASVFTGDQLLEKSNREGLKMYLDRWQKKIKEWEEMAKELGYDDDTRS
jgi:hypothetical protein